MLAWTRVTDPTTRCGGPCRRTLLVGEPLYLITLEGVRVSKKRCAACAGVPVPADLAPLAAPPIGLPPAPYLVVTRRSPVIDVEPADWKARASGDREVGEEG